MTTLLIIIGVLLIIEFQSKPEITLTKDEAIDFAQSVTNLEVTIEDFNQWYSHHCKSIRFSDN